MFANAGSSYLFGKTYQIHMDEMFQSMEAEKSHFLTLISAHDMISRHAVVVMEWTGRLITSCCSSGLTQDL